MTSWQYFGEISNVVQLSGLNALAIIVLIFNAANTARAHKEKCTQFEKYLETIRNFLEKRNFSEMKNIQPEFREILNQLEGAVERANILVNICKDRSYLYVMAMGWSIEKKFRTAEQEIERYWPIVLTLMMVPDNARDEVEVSCRSSDVMEVPRNSTGCQSQGETVQEEIDGSCKVLSGCHSNVSGKCMEEIYSQEETIERSGTILSGSNSNVIQRKEDVRLQVRTHRSISLEDVNLQVQSSSPRSIFDFI